MRGTPPPPAAGAGPFLFAAMVLCIAVRAGEARADDPTAADKALAESLFRDGRKLMDSGPVLEACAKLAESQRIDPKLGTLLNLAACHEKAGLSASAWAEFTEATSLATNMGQSERADFAKSRALDLERRLSRLTIEMAMLTPDIVIALNERTLSVAALGSEFPLDPGDYTVKVTATGKQPWTERLTIDIGPSAKRLMIPALKDVVIAPPSGKKPPSQHPLSQHPPSQHPPSQHPLKESAPREGMGPLFVGGLVAGGVGLVGITVGAVFGLRTFTKASVVEDNCTGQVCNPTGLAANEEAYASAGVSTAAFTIGIACAASGAGMVFLSRSSEKKKASGHNVWVAPQVSGSGGRLTVGSQW